MRRLVRYRRSPACETRIRPQARVARIECRVLGNRDAPERTIARQMQNVDLQRPRRRRRIAMKSIGVVAVWIVVGGLTLGLASPVWGQQSTGQSGQGTGQGTGSSQPTGQIPGADSGSGLGSASGTSSGVRGTIPRGGYRSRREWHRRDGPHLGEVLRHADG